jgi:hypothetical protein
MRVPFSHRSNLLASLKRPYTWPEMTNAFEAFEVFEVFATAATTDTIAAVVTALTTMTITRSRLIQTSYFEIAAVAAHPQAAATVAVPCRLTV